MINIVKKEVEFDDELKNKANEINDIINNLKPTMMNKNNYTISNVDIDQIKKYIEQTNDTTSNLKDSNDINVILDKYEEDLKNHSNEVKELKKKIITREDRISDLENRLDFANDTIDMLEDKVDKLQEALDYFKELWNKFIKFLQDKFFSSNKYDDLIDELHEEEIIDDDGKPIGVILCAEKDNVMLEYALGGLSNNIFASTYTYYIPNKEQLISEVEKVLESNAN